LHAARFFPRSALLWKEVALCYKQMENFEQACEALLEARQRAKGAFARYVDAQLALYVRRKGVLEAKAHIELAIAQAPEDLRYYHFRAFIEAATKIEDTLGPEDAERALVSPRL
jgi:tetratricopeptide (TPR) repeat protein